MVNAHYPWLVKKVLLIGLIFALSSCGVNNSVKTQVAPTAATMTEQALPKNMAGKWILVRWIGKGTPVLPEVSPRFAFDASSVTFQTGCNSFEGSYAMSGNSATFEQIGGTRRGCSEPLAQLETALMNVLAQPVEVKIQGNKMTWTTAYRQQLDFVRIRY